MNARAILDSLPGIKQSDMKPCALCKKGVAHDANILFWRLRFDRLGLDLSAVQAQRGLELMLGSAEIANVMGPNRDIAKVIDGPHEVMVCEPCVEQRLLGLMLIAEDQNEAEEGQNEPGAK